MNSERTVFDLANEKKTAADIALAGISVAAEKSAAPVGGTSKYLPGMYRSDKYMRIIKALTYTHRKDDAGKVHKTYGTWAKDDNMIIFKKGVETPLTAEDLELPAVQRLVDSKTIYRLG